MNYDVTTKLETSLKVKKPNGYQERPKKKKKKKKTKEKTKMSEKSGVSGGRTKEQDFKIKANRQSCFLSKEHKAAQKWDSTGH